MAILRARATQTPPRFLQVIVTHKKPIIRAVSESENSLTALFLRTFTAQSTIFPTTNTFFYYNK